MNKPQIDVGFHPPRRASPLSLSNDNNSLGFRRLASSMDLGPRERRRGGEGGEGREDGALLGFGVAGLVGSGEGGEKFSQAVNHIATFLAVVDCGKNTRPSFIQISSQKGIPFAEGILPDFSGCQTRLKEGDPACLQRQGFYYSIQPQHTKLS